MSNPTVTLGFDIPLPTVVTEREAFTRVVYEQEKFFAYARGEFDAAYTVFDPSDKGETSFFFISIEDCIESAYGVGEKPEFVSDQVFDETLKFAPSGFLSIGATAGMNSVLPKIIIPSTLLVDNGSADVEKYKARTTAGENLLYGSGFTVFGS